MPGLLDYQVDPIAMGLLGAGGALMTPRAQGGGIGAAMQAFPQQMMQGQQAQQQMALRAMQMKLMQSGIEENQAQAMARKALADRQAAEAARADRQRVGQQEILGGIATANQPGFKDASIALGGTAPAGYQPPGQRNPITQEVAARWAANGGDLATLKQLAESGDWGRREVARVLDQADAQGRPTQQQFDKFGQPVGGAVNKPYEKRLVNTGGAQVGYDPFTLGLTGSSIANTMTPDGKASNAVAWANNALTKRGQDLTDARSRDLAAATRESGSAGRVPQGYRSKPDGTLEFIPGGPADPATKADKTPNEGQTKDYLFASRAAAAHKIVMDLGNKPSVAAVGIKQGLSGIPLIGGSLGSGANAALSPASQQYEQAKRDFINAVLRKESGAVIADSEFENADKQYFPQPFDSAAVRQQKAENRQRAIDGISAGAGPLRPGLNAAPAGTADNDPLGLRR
jgi:hypothetical protein